MNKHKVEQETKNHIELVRNLIDQIVLDLKDRAIDHDQSKLSSPEKEIFEIYTPRLKNTTYGSSEYKQYLKEMKNALAHHYDNNRHHPEYFKNGIRGMNLVDLIEMLCDWLAATKRHEDGDILKSLEINQKRFGYSDEFKNILKNTLSVLE